MFSYALLDVLRNGNLYRPLQLSLRDLKELAEDRLAALPEQNALHLGLHSPDQSEGDLADVPFFPNPRAEEERRRRAEEAEQARLARQERMRQIEGERRRQAEIERQRITPNETIFPPLAEPGSAQRSNSAAAGPFPHVTSPLFLPGNQLRQEPPPEVLVASRITRRKVVLGLGLTGLAVAGGGIALLVSSQGQHPPVVSSQTPASTPRQTPTPRRSPAPSLTPPPLGILLFTYWGHCSIVYAVAWSPDDKRIASASFDFTVQVWGAVDGGQVFTYMGHSNPVDAVAWSSDGKRIASGGWDNTVQVWDAANGSHVFTYKGHSSYVNAVAWSPDGTRIASGSGNAFGSSDTAVQVWEAE